MCETLTSVVVRTEMVTTGKLAFNHSCVWKILINASTFAEEFTFTLKQITLIPRKGLSKTILEVLLKKKR